MPEINIQEQIPHLQAINQISDLALLHLIKSNTGLNLSYGYTANNKQYKINIQIKEVNR